MIILIIVLIILIFLIYYLFFLENYIYIENNFLENEDLKKIKNVLNNIKKLNENKYKKFIKLDKEKYKQIYDIIYKNDKLKKIIKKEFNKEFRYPKYPIEYRIYKEQIELLPWHQDKKLMNNYLECIYIIENTSDSKFQYLKKLKIHDYVQKNNDLIIVKPKDIIHRITEINNGNKIILKFIINL